MTRRNASPYLTRTGASGRRHDHTAQRPAPKTQMSSREPVQPLRHDAAPGSARSPRGTRVRRPAPVEDPAPPAAPGMRRSNNRRAVATGRRRSRGSIRRLTGRPARAVKGPGPSGRPGVRTRRPGRNARASGKAAGRPPAGATPAANMACPELNRHKAVRGEPQTSISDN